jgi:hypothetical protein
MIRGAVDEQKVPGRHSVKQSLAQALTGNVAIVKDLEVSIDSELDLIIDFAKRGRGIQHCFARRRHLAKFKNSEDKLRVSTEHVDLRCDSQFDPCR